MMMRSTMLLAATMLAGLAACSDKTAKTTNTTTTTAAATDTAAPVRVRGVVTAVGPDSVAVQTYDGNSATVVLGDKTGYAWVLPASLSTLKQGDFIGTATTGGDDALQAVEVVIFPESMRGTGEGHYDWDTPAVTQTSGARGGTSGMTNGTVTGSGMTNGTVTQSGMTNGTVAQSGMTNGTVSNSSGTAGVQQLTVSYKGGTAKVAVPARTPIVRFDPAQKAILTVGQKVFVVTEPGTDGKPTAKFVAAGKDGLMPPM